MHSEDYRSVASVLRNRELDLLPRISLCLREGGLLSNIIPRRIYRHYMVHRTGELENMLWLQYLDQHNELRSIPLYLIQGFGISHGIASLAGTVFATFTYYSPRDGIEPEPPDKIRYVRVEEAVYFGVQQAHPNERPAFWIEGEQFEKAEKHFEWHKKKFPLNRMEGVLPGAITHDSVYTS